MRSSAGSGLGTGVGGTAVLHGVGRSAQVQGAVVSDGNDFQLPWGTLGPRGFCIQNLLSSCLTMQIPGLTPAHLGRCI